MSELYGPQHQALQEAFATAELAKRVRDNIVTPEFDDMHKGFIESRDMFFLTTIDHRGYPTCSYKGGNPGFVQVVDNRTLVFPSYDGNGMFLSMGNISTNSRIGMLFIDFETPHRVRVHGDAEIVRDGEMLARFPGADLLVRVRLAEVFVNCPRYIHKHQRIATSPYVPQLDGQAPLPPWKRIEGLQDALLPRDRELVAAQGTISPEEYADMVRNGRA